MKFTHEIRIEIVNALMERLKRQDRSLGTCSICGNQTNPRWSLDSGFVTLIATDDPAKIMLGGRSYPCAVLICTLCGNTQLLNLNVLGLEHLSAPDTSPEPATLDADPVLVPPDTRQPTKETDAS